MAQVDDQTNLVIKTFLIVDMVSGVKWNDRLVMTSLQFFACQYPMILTLSNPVVSNGYTSKCLGPYWSNPPF